jgi:pimeloyl-ACP methyl ester carboxylesterase
VELAAKEDIKNLIRAERSVAKSKRVNLKISFDFVPLPLRGCSHSAQDEGNPMNFLFSPPSLDDLIRLLKAWRFWVLGALVGALLGTALFYIAPPPYRARATVNVDFNIEEAWPEETDRQQIYYLEREARKLVEIAWSDAVMQTIADATSVDAAQLRYETLSLSQPGEAGWRFYADDSDRARAEAIASAWALAFTQQAQADMAEQVGLNALVRVDAVQVVNLPVSRKVSKASYVMSGAVGFLALSALLVLFIKPKKA